MLDDFFTYFKLIANTAYDLFVHTHSCYRCALLWKVAFIQEDSVNIVVLELVSQMSVRYDLLNLFPMRNQRL